MIQIKNNSIRKIHNFWNNIHFHPTDAIEDSWGQHILDEIAKDNVAETVRMYAMLEDIVSMDENRVLQYDFTINDERLDYLTEKGFEIFLSYNFMPACIAADSEETSRVCKNKTRYKGKLIITSPPKDYDLWEEVCYQYTKHIVECYGIETVSKWHLQCFNEPDIPEFFMTNLDMSDKAVMTRLIEYKKLYKHFVRGVMRASSDLSVGGPALAARLDFMDGFLSFVKEESLKLDFICFHTYGTTPDELNSSARPLHAENTIERYLECEKVIKKYYPDGIKIIVDEWGASTAGYFNSEECPQLIFREDSRFSAYFGKMISAYIDKNISVLKMMICLSGQHEMTTDFSGFRNFFTLNFIKKPIYNAYILARKLYDNLLPVQHENIDLSVLATKSDDDKYAILLSYASENFDKALPEINDTLEIYGVYGKRNLKIWCIDEKHTNPYNTALENGWKDLKKEQIYLLQNIGNITPIMDIEINAEGVLKTDVNFTNNAFVLIEF